MKPFTLKPVNLYARFWEQINAKDKKYLYETRMPWTALNLDYNIIYDIITQNSQLFFSWGFTFTNYQASYVCHTQ